MLSQETVGLSTRYELINSDCGTGVEAGRFFTGSPDYTALVDQQHRDWPGARQQYSLLAPPGVYKVPCWATAGEQ
jgi:hypothetical protein